VTRTHAARATHYDSAILPVRLRKLRLPRKGKTIAIAEERPGDWSSFRPGCTTNSNCHCERSEAISCPLKLPGTRLLRRATRASQ
jgi:hypothetical protein